MGLTGDTEANEGLQVFGSAIFGTEAFGVETCFLLSTEVDVVCCQLNPEGRSLSEKVDAESLALVSIFVLGPRAGRPKQLFGSYHGQKAVVVRQPLCENVLSSAWALEQGLRP